MLNEEQVALLRELDMQERDTKSLKEVIVLFRKKTGAKFTNSEAYSILRNKLHRDRSYSVRRKKKNPYTLEKRLREVYISSPHLTMEECIKLVGIDISRRQAYTIVYSKRKQGCVYTEKRKRGPKSDTIKQEHGHLSKKKKDGLWYRVEAKDRPYRCPVCGMGDPIVGRYPFKSQEEADKCCSRLALYDPMRDTD